MRFKWSVERACASAGSACALVSIPAYCVAQGDVFLRGATSLQTSLASWLTPLGAIALIVLGLCALFGVVSWGRAVIAMVGVVIVFGAPQLILWIRGMAGV